MPRHNYLASGRYNRRGANYPRSVDEVLDESMRFRGAVLRAVKAFRRSKPFRGELAERREKFGTLHGKLCEIYGTRTRLEFNAGRPANGSYSPLEDVIRLDGKLSVITYLHEFAHSIFGSDEVQACRWSVNLFRRLFPRSYARLVPVGHTLRRAEDATPREPLGDHILAALLSLNGARVGRARLPRRCRRRRNGDECPDDTGENC